MRETERIAEQLRRAYEGGAWHGPSVREVLEGVTAAQAMARPVAGAHSIWEIAQHIGVWETAAMRRMNGDPANLTPEEDWPAAKATDEAAWARVQQNLEAGNRALREAILALDDSRLDQPILDGFSTYYGTLHGVVQHDLYHAGQIALLKKANSP